MAVSAIHTNAVDGWVEVASVAYEVPYLFDKFAVRVYGKDHYCECPQFLKNQHLLKIGGLLKFIVLEFLALKAQSL